MLQTIAVRSGNSIHIRVLPLLRALLPFVVVISMFGAPNGLFLYYPRYPLIMLFCMSAFTLLFVMSKQRGGALLWPSVNVNYALLFYFTLSFLSLAYAPNAAMGLRQLGSVVFKAIIFYIIVDVCRDSATLRRMLKFITILGVIFALHALSQIIGIAVLNTPPTRITTGEFNNQSVDYGVLSYGIFGLSKQAFGFQNIVIPRCQSIFLEPGFFANFLELTIFATLAYFALRPGRRYVSGTLLGVQLFALLMTLSPVGLLATGLGMIVYVLFTFRWKARIYSRYLVRGGLALAALCAVIQIKFPNLLAYLYKISITAKFISDQTTLTSSADRFRLLTTSVHLFFEKPFLGWGSNQSVIASGGMIANNAILTAAVELGIVGLILYCLILANILKVVVVNYRLARKSSSAAQRQFAAATAGSMIALMVHSLFVETQWTFYYWIGVALLYVSYRALVQSAQGQDTFSGESGSVQENGSGGHD